MLVQHNYSWIIFTISFVKKDSFKSLDLSLPIQRCSLAMTYVGNFLPKPSSLSWVKLSIISSKFQLPLDFISIYLSHKIFFCHLFGP